LRVLLELAIVLRTGLLGFHLGISIYSMLIQCLVTQRLLIAVFVPSVTSGRGKYLENIQANFYLSKI